MRRETRKIDIVQIRQDSPYFCAHLNREQEKIDNQSVVLEQLLEEFHEKQDAIKQEVSKREILKQEISKQEILKQEISKQGIVKKEELRQEALKKEQERQRQEALQKEKSQKETANKVMSLADYEVWYENMTTLFIYNTEYEIELLPKKKTEPTAKEETLKGAEEIKLQPIEESRQPKEEKAKDDKENKAPEEVKQKTAEKVIRSVATSLHADSKEENLDTSLTMVVDMRKEMEENEENVENVENEEKCEKKLQKQQRELQFHEVLESESEEMKEPARPLLMVGESFFAKFKIIFRAVLTFLLIAFCGYVLLIIANMMVQMYRHYQAADLLGIFGGVVMLFSNMMLMIWNLWEDVFTRIRKKEKILWVVFIMLGILLYFISKCLGADTKELAILFLESTV